MRILFVSANSRKAYLDIEREQRALLKLADQGNHYLKLLPAAQIEDLQDELTGKNGKKARFDVLHFAGHGKTTEGIILRKRKSEESEPLSAQQLVDLLDEAKKANIGLKLVVLNACQTEPLVEKAKEHVDAIIGTERVLDDRVAREFTNTFYDELHNKATVKTAFNAAAEFSGPYIREGKDEVTLPQSEPPGEAKVEGLGEFYEKYYGDYVDDQIKRLKRDQRLNNYVFWGLMGIGVCLWIYLFQNATFEGVAADERAFWPNLKEGFANAFFPDNGESGADLFTMQDLWGRVKALEGFAPALIAFFQRRVFAHIGPKIEGLRRLRDAISKWDDLPKADQDAVRSAMHASFKDSLKEAQKE